MDSLGSGGNAVGSPVPDDWIVRLSAAIADSLGEFGRRAGPLAIVDLGCFPWHGTLELSALTVAEATVDPALLNPAEVAAWVHYNFSAGLSAWVTAAELGRQMGRAYGASAAPDRTGVVAAYIRACVSACGSSQVASALGGGPGGQLRVCHPDTSEQFWPPPPSRGNRGPAAS
jgi:hypothetical protein